MKLAAELQKRSTGRTVYVLDEPTTGLHFEDIRRLLRVLGSLVDAGNSVIVIEHNLDVIKTADWVIDLGPEGGSGGGKIVATGTPEDVACMSDSPHRIVLGADVGQAQRVEEGGRKRPAAKASKSGGSKPGPGNLIDSKVGPRPPGRETTS